LFHRRRRGVFRRKEAARALIDYVEAE
jgi:hypothetical protein